MEDKLVKFEELLNLSKNSVFEEMLLEDLPQWDSLIIMSIQAYISLYNDDITMDLLRKCCTVRDVCKYLD